MLIIIVVTMFLKPVFPVLEYLVNYDYVSKVLCENKDKPMMHCNGKCHLMKELAKESENEKPLSNDKKSSVNEFEILFFNEIKPLEIIQICFLNSSEKESDNYSNLYCHLKSTSIFHPPTVS